MVKSFGYESKKIIEEGNLDDLGKLMHEHWIFKKKRSLNMTNNKIDQYYNFALKNGALGGKLIGAGGGGFLMFYCEDANFLEKKLKILGFKTKILEFKEKGSKPVKNLYARLGNKGPNFCYAGHLDVVPAGNLKDWTINPFKPSIKNGYLIGRGANDMKSSIAAFVSAVSNFATNKKRFNGSISLLITGDEEGIAINGTKKVVEYLKKKK